MLYLLIGFWLLGLLITWALVAIGGEPLPPSRHAAAPPASAARRAAGPRASRSGRVTTVA